MNTILIIISIPTIFLFIWILSGNAIEEEKKPVNYTRPLKIKPPVVKAAPPPEKVEEKISLPRQFRRAQQALGRQRAIILNNVKEMAHQARVLDISSQLVNIQDQQSQVQDAIVNLKHKELDIAAAQTEVTLSNREGLLKLNEARNALEKETINSIKLKAENDIERGLMSIDKSKLELQGYENNLQSQRLQIQAEKMELDEYGNQLAHKDRLQELIKIDLLLTDKSLNNKSDEIRLDHKGNLQELKEIDLRLTDKSLDNKRGQIRNQLDKLNIKAKNNEISFKDQVNKLNAQEVKLKRLGLENVKDSILSLNSKVELNKKDAQLKVREGMITLKNQDLLNKKNAIGNLMDKMSNKEEKIKIAEKSMKLTYERAQLQYKNLLNEILYQFKNLKLERRANSLQAKQEQLKLYEYRLNNLSQYINQMYEIKSQWNKIESRENNIQFKENQLRLDRKYHNTQRALDHLRLYRYENDLRFREQKMELQKMIDSMRSWW